MNTKLYKNKTNKNTAYLGMLAALIQYEHLPHLMLMLFELDPCND